MKLYDFGLTIIICLAFALCYVGTTKHSTGYDKAILVKDATPISPLYYSIEGTEDKNLWWDMETVQVRARYLAALVGYNGTDIACSADGKYLYIGID